MAIVKTAELSGDALDWAVAKCENEDYIAESGVNGIGMEYDATSYSTNWSQGGPIIEREGMHVDCLRMANHYRAAIWEAWPYATGTKHIMQGRTPLIAAMRCYVASKLGDNVDVPSELL